MAIKVEQGSQTLSWFNDRLKEKRLTFRPPFQRNPVWLDKHRAYLIDTVLRNLPIPEVYMQKETDEEGGTIYALVDGQQRVRALLDFPRGKVELMEVYTPGRDGQTWDDLSRDEKKNYWNYRLVVREVVDATDADLRDLFQRLNQNTVTLNAQEIRNARFKGEFIKTVTDLANQDFWAEHRIVTAAEIRRMIDIEYMAELLIGIMWGPQNKKTTVDIAFQKFEVSFPEKQQWLKRFEDARTISFALLPDIANTRWRGKSDYYSLFLALDSLNQVGHVSSNRRAAAARAIREFGENITQRLSKEATRGRVRSNVRQYATAVEKAASDKDRRQARHEILVSLLKPFYTPR
jgi:hypothetical protein